MIGFARCSVVCCIVRAAVPAKVASLLYRRAERQSAKYGSVLNYALFLGLNSVSGIGGYLYTKDRTDPHRAPCNYLPLRLLPGGVVCRTANIAKVFGAGLLRRTRLGLYYAVVLPAQSGGVVVELLRRARDRLCIVVPLVGGVPLCRVGDKDHIRPFLVLYHRRIHLQIQYV